MIAVALLCAGVCRGCLRSHIIALVGCKGPCRPNTFLDNMSWPQVLNHMPTRTRHLGLSPKSLHTLCVLKRPPILREFHVLFARFVFKVLRFLLALAIAHSN